ncbi:hypothetical protein BV20DRAFT_158071 [Pilatotrama ljubarskyi]|nr:hypothetical protein BV20DRAFT_158071 [Pilatotrama ljubarskyi]
MPHSQACPHDTVSGSTIDGKSFTLWEHDIDPDDQSFAPFITFIKTLNINTTANPSAPVQRLLDSTRLLRRLTIKVGEDYDVPPARGATDAVKHATYFIHPPTFYLSAGSLPALRSLVLHNAHVMLMRTFVCTLRRLVLSGSSRFVRPLSLAQLLDAFKHFIRLEQLEVRNYLMMPRPDDPRSLPVVSFWSLKEFKYLVVQDDAPNVSKILSHLLVPAHVDVRAVANVAAGLCPDEAAAIFAAMLPDCTRKLATFCLAQAVELRDAPSHGCSLSAIGNGRRLIFELDASAGGDSTPGHCTHGSLYKALLKSLNIMRSAPVTTLVFSGALAAVDMGSWVGAIEGFSNLRTLEVENSALSQEGSSESPVAILHALITPSRFRAGQVICPQLTSVTLRRFVFTPNFFVAVYHCFTHRVRLGATRLESLVIELYAGPGEWRKSSEVEEYRPALNSLAQDVIIICPPTGFIRTAKLF